MSSSPETDAEPSRVIEAAKRVIPVVGVLILMVMMTRDAARPLGNYDTWFHLRLGREFLGPWSLLHPGALTTFATSEWVPTQWSTEILMAKVEDWFGLPGVAWLFGALYVLFIGGVYALCRREGGPLASIVPTTLAVFGATTALSARPQVVSLIFFTVAVGAWLKTFKDGKPRWWLIPMTWVWASAHGLWSSAILVGGVCWLGMLLDRRVGFRASLKLLAVPVLSLVATALTPVGPRLLLGQSAVLARASLISEWGPTSFRELAPLLVALMIAGIVVLWARRGSTSWTKVLLFLLASGWSAYYVRMVPLGGIALAPLLAEALEDLLPGNGQPTRVRGAERLSLVAGAVACLAALALVVPHTADKPDGVPGKSVASRLASLPAGTTVLDADNVGGWLEWKYPDLNPVIDGMFDAYPVSYIEGWRDASLLVPGWQQFVAKSGARVAVLEHGSPLAGAMKDQLHWQQQAKNNGWVFLAAPGG